MLGYKRSFGLDEVAAVLGLALVCGFGGRRFLCGFERLLGPFDGVDTPVGVEGIADFDSGVENRPLSTSTTMGER
ncbi:MAG: hypothetical protein QGG73_12325, partial [Candidatus Hydrogenedentes bacterium]|nr:hypothetical protein [Candidatus Hydrogenedentota bacterium]